MNGVRDTESVDGNLSLHLISGVYAFWTLPSSTKKWLGCWPQCDTERCGVGAIELATGTSKSSRLEHEVRGALLVPPNKLSCNLKPAESDSFL